jgi:tetratricopeptide (TPR) repeat protein
MALRTLILTIAALGIALSTGPVGAADRALSLVQVDSEPADGRANITEAELERLTKAVADAPQNREARFDLTRGLMRAGNLDGALEAARAWRDVDAYNLVVVRLLGDIYAEKGERKNALRAYSAVVELLPEDPNAQRALASVLKANGELDAAYDRLLAATELRPDDARLSFELADVAHRLDRTAEAQRLFEEIANDPQAPQSIAYPAKQRLAQIYSTRVRATEDTSDRAALSAAIDELNIAGGVNNDIKIYLTWDTDRSDVDLWVTNPAGEKVFYSNKKGKYGGALFHDVTSGYGPESFTAKTARPGTYTVEVNYFSAGRSNFSEARGEVIVVLDEGTATEKRHVLPYRLFSAKQTVTVARIEVN